MIYCPFSLDMRGKITHRSMRWHLNMLMIQATIKRVESRAINEIRSQISLGMNELSIHD